MPSFDLVVVRPRMTAASAASTQVCALRASLSRTFCTMLFVRSSRACVRETDHSAAAASTSRWSWMHGGAEADCFTARRAPIGSGGGSAAAVTTSDFASIGSFSTASSHSNPSRIVPPTVAPLRAAVAAAVARRFSRCTMTATIARLHGRPKSVRVPQLWPQPEAAAMRAVPCGRCPLRAPPWPLSSRQSETCAPPRMAPRAPRPHRGCRQAELAAPHAAARIS